MDPEPKKSRKRSDRGYISVNKVVHERLKLIAARRKTSVSQLVELLATKL